MIKNFVFDFGNVLVSCDTGRVLRPYFTDQEQAETFLRMMASREVLDRFDLEDVPFSELIAEYKQRYPRWTEPLQAFYDRAAEFAYREEPGMRELLTRLREEGYHLYGLSNWGSVVRQVMDRYPIFELLEGHVVSSEVGMLKPDARIYRCLLERYHMQADECLFVDDRPENIRGAQAVGMHAIQFVSAEQFLGALRDARLL